MKSMIWISPLLALLTSAAMAQEAPDTAESLRRLEEKIDGLQQQMIEKDRRIDELESRVQELQTGNGPSPAAMSAIDEALADVERRQAASKPDGIASFPLGGGSRARLMDISMNVLFGMGGSTERDESLETLQGGAHDPKRRGFTFQQAELSLSGAVDPYFFGEAHLIFIEEGVELEEAFLTTQALPHGLELEGGTFFTEFGRINPVHPHAWDWVDQPVVLSRFFGGDGMRGPGVRLGWLAPLPWFSQFHFGAQNATGATMASFRGEGLAHHGEEGGGEEHPFEEGIGGRPIIERETRSFQDLVYLLRWENSWDLNDEWSMLVGGSGLFGPNNTGDGGDTRIYGGDLTVKWRDKANQRGFPFLKWQTEVMWRDFTADAYFNDDDPAEVFDLPAGEINDWGLYTQLLYGFQPGWSAGMRYEFANGSGDSFEEGLAISHSLDPFRDERQRFSPLLVWQPTEFSRIRLQYNYDIADHLDEGDAHSVWLVFEVLFGSHSAHRY